MQKDVNNIIDFVLSKCSDKIDSYKLNLDQEDLESPIFVVKTQVTKRGNYKNTPWIKIIDRRKFSRYCMNKCRKLAHELSNLTKVKLG